MKKFLLLVLVLSFKYSQGQWVTIPDSNFVLKLTQLYPTCMNGNMMDTTCNAIVNDTDLYVNNSNIHDLTGIGYFNNLKLFNCSGNQLTTLPNLPSSLTFLNCSNNPLLSIPQLPNNLIKFACYVTPLTSLPPLPSTIEEIICYNSQLSSLPSLPTSLKILNCFDNLLVNLPQLPDSLEKLWCWENQLVALPSLPEGLNNLNCHHNLLTSLPILPQSLEEINCSDNLITSIDVLPDSLVSLVCSNNLLTNLPPLPNTLLALICYYNQISYIPEVPVLMSSFGINNNAVKCVHNLPNLFNPANVNLSNNLLTCVPNQTNYYVPYPVCLSNDPINNSYDCVGANIAGNLFMDADSNCLLSNFDIPTNNVPIKLLDAQNNLIAQNYTINGAYYFTVAQPDSFKIKVDLNSIPLSMSCSASNVQSVFVDSINQTISNINFPVSCNNFDVNLLSITTNEIAFPGLNHTLLTNIISNENYFNINCDNANYSGTVSINIIGPVNYVSPGINSLLPIVNGNQFNYFISDFNNLNPNSFNLILNVDTAAQVGDQICVYVEISTSPTDSDSINNTYEFCYNAVNSYDPNMKEVYPVNVLPGFDDWLTYTIHFQNTGNAPAFNIRLIDTLDTQLNINTFEMLAYSHPANVTLNGNILTVRFDNIMLPDSTTDHDGSMGYFQYRIKPLPNLPQGTQISNTAYIYFDYNAPIVTNTTQNNFDFITGVKDITDNNTFVLYPNPSAGLFNFIDNSKIKTVEVYNLLGEKILSQTNQKQIDLRHCAKGIYFVKINGTTMFKLVKEQ